MRSNPNFNVCVKTTKFHILFQVHIEIERCLSSPNSESNFVQELSYAGVQRLLGFIYTAGTVSEALPPPTSSLISSFLLPHNPNV